MALVSVAPTEKTENLVYLLFPTAVALYLATTWTSHVAAWPLLIGIVAPLGGIVLYEIPIDLWVAKEFYRKRIRKGEWSSTNGAEPKVLLRLRKDMAKAYLILRAYENTVTFPGLPSNVDDVHIRDTDVQLQDTVSSHYVHRRLWEVRATIWILVSTPFLIFTLGPLALRVNVVPSSLVMVGTPASAAFLAVLILVFDWNRKKNKFRNDLRYIVFGLFLLYISFCIVFFPPSWNQTNLILTSLTATTIVAILYANIRRNHHLVRHIELLITYYYWQRHIAIWSGAKVEEADAHRSAIRRELDNLQTLLNRNDTSVFASRWRDMHQSMIRRFEDEFPEYLRKHAFQKWMRVLHLHGNGENASDERNQLGWMLFYMWHTEMSPCDKDETAQKIMLHLMTEFYENGELRDLDASGVLELLPDESLAPDEKRKANPSDLLPAIGIAFAGKPIPNASELARTMVNDFGRCSDIGFDRTQVASFLVRYATMVFQADPAKRKYIFTNTECSRFREIFDKAQDHPNRLYLLIDFVESSDSEQKTTLLRESMAALAESSPRIWMQFLALREGGNLTQRLKEELVKAHFSRESYLFGKAEDSEERFKLVARMMAVFLDWGLVGRCNEIERLILQKLASLHSEAQGILREKWGRKDRQRERERLVAELRELAGEKYVHLFRSESGEA